MSKVGRRPNNASLTEDKRILPDGKVGDEGEAGAEGRSHSAVTDVWGSQVSNLWRENNQWPAATSLTSLDIQ